MATKKVTGRMPKVLRKDRNTAAIISKLNSKENDNNSGASIKAANIPTISNSIIDRIKNNENIRQLFPDVELAMQILTSSILAPNDMLTTKLTYRLNNITLPSDINAHILNIISNYVDKTEDIENKLTDIVNEALFTKGSYAEAIIPEAVVDDIVNSDMSGEVSVEDYIDGIKSDTKYISVAKDIKISSEDYNNTFKFETIYVDEGDLGITILDNNKTLAVVEASKKLLNKKMLETVGVSTESDDMLDNLFRKPDYKQQDIVISGGVNEASRESIGKPLTFKLPAESVIPVHAIGDPTDHLGYFILLDEKGAPISMDTELPKKEDDIDTLIQTGKDTKLNIIKKAKTALQGITRKDPKLENIEDLYTTLVIKQMEQRLQGGMLGDIAAISDNNDIYRVMLRRALIGMQTKMLFLPKEQVAYYAFDYRKNGTGRSMLEKVSMLFSIRAIILFTRLMANIKNSITTTEVSAELDENDMDPEKTMNRIISESMKTRQTQLPIGVTKIDDLVDWTHKVGYKFNFKHPALPDMTIDTSDNSTSKIVPDDELDEMIQEHIIMSFGLTPEMVKSGYDPEFATTVLANNLLLAKRVIRLQDKLIPQITAHVQKLLINNDDIKNKIRNVVSDNISNIIKYLKKNKHYDTDNIEHIYSDKSKVVEYITTRYLVDLEVTLPRPEVKESEDMKESFDKYKDTLDDYLELIISEDAMPEELLGELSGKLDSVKAVMKTVLIKKWMNENGYLPEIANFLTLDDEGKPTFNLLDEYQDLAESLVKSILPFIKKNSKFVEKTNDKLEDDDNDEEDDDTDTGDTDTGDNGTSNDNDDNDTGDVENDDSASDDSGDTPEDTDDISGDKDIDKF